MNKNKGATVIMGVFLVLAMFNSMVFADVTNPILDRALKEDQQQLDKENGALRENINSRAAITKTEDKQKLLSVIATDLCIDNSDNIIEAENKSIYAYNIKGDSNEINTKTLSVLSKIHSNSKYEYKDTIDLGNGNEILILFSYNNTVERD